MPEIYKGLVSPVLDKLDSETWHLRAREALHFAEMHPFTLKILEQFAYRRKRFTDERLNVVLGGTIHLDNPVMFGAGWDKAGRAVRGLYSLGFSGGEVGGVLAYPQPGNDKPRQWMIGPGVSLNRLGFNTPGDEEVAKNLKRYEKDGIPIGINVGKNKRIPDKVAPEMYSEVIKTLYKYASFFVFNVSSPNTPGLRALQDKEPLNDIAQMANQVMDELGGRLPSYIKVQPGLSRPALGDVIQVVIDNGFTGIIPDNTTTDAYIKGKYGEEWRNEMGGLAGNDEDYRKMTLRDISHIYREAGDRIEQIGVGGVNSAITARDKIMAGVKAVEVVTGIREVGSTLPGRINRGLIEFMDQEGVKDLSELVGVRAKDF